VSFGSNFYLLPGYFSLWAKDEGAPYYSFVFLAVKFLLSPSSKSFVELTTWVTEKLYL